MSDHDFAEKDLGMRFIFEQAMKEFPMEGDKVKTLEKVLTAAINDFANDFYKMFPQLDPDEDRVRPLVSMAFAAGFLNGLKAIVDGTLPIEGLNDAKRDTSTGTFLDQFFT